MTPNQKETIIRMRQSGTGYAAIAEKLGISKNTVKTFCRRNDLAGVGGKPADEKPCLQCGKPVPQKPGRKQKKFCCDLCRSRYWDSHIEETKRSGAYLSGHPPDKTSPRLRFLCQFSLSGPVPISSRLFIPGTSTMNHRRPDPQVFGQNTNILTCLRRCQHHVLQPQFLLPEFLQEKYSSALSMRFSLS